MHWQVEAEKVLVNDSFLDHNLIEVGHHVVDSSEVDHLHVEAKRFSNIDDFDVHCI